MHRKIWGKRIFHVSIVNIYNLLQINKISVRHTDNMNELVVVSSPLTSKSECSIYTVKLNSYIQYIQEKHLWRL